MVYVHCVALATQLFARNNEGLTPQRRFHKYLIQSKGNETNFADQLVLDRYSAGGDEQRFAAV
jgi:hypothetical protein